MKYAVGQKVRIRPDLNQGMSIRFGVNGDMARMAGKVVTIKEVTSSSNGEDTCYKLRESRWSWHRDMFVPVEITRDEAFNMLLSGSVSDEEYERIIQKEGEERG
jgi:hypothetical protein